MAGGPDPGSTNTSLARHGGVPLPDLGDAGKAIKVKSTEDGYELVASPGFGASAAATTPGTVVKKIEVFDAAGASLGFVAIYDAIT